MSKLKRWLSIGSQVHVSMLGLNRFRFDFRFLTTIEKEMPFGDWRRKDVDIKTDRLTDEEIDAFLFSKMDETPTDENRLLKNYGETSTSNSNSEATTSSSEAAIKKAMAICEEQLEMAGKETKAEEAQSLSSKFEDSKIVYEKELEAGIQLDDLSSAIVKERKQHFGVQELLDAFENERMEEAVASSFGPLRKPPSYNTTIAKEGEDFSNLKPAVTPSTQPIPKGGFRINIYRNVTGSVKQLLVVLRKDALDKVIQIIQQTDTENKEFMDLLLESLKLTDEKLRTDLRPQMNQICIHLLGCLEKLHPDEIALVCSVFGHLGYSNSLVFYQLFAKLQQPEVINTMRTESLVGTVLSLGMLQSTEPAFMRVVEDEFVRRLKETEAQLPMHSFASLLLGCCHSRHHVEATKFASELIQLLMKDDLDQDSTRISWMDLTAALYVSAQLKLIQPDLLKGVLSRLKNTKKDWDLTCTEVSVMLIALEMISPTVSKTPYFSIWEEIYTLLEDRVGELIEQNQILATSVPDLIRNLSFPKFERIEYFQPLGKRIVESDAFDVKLPIWTLVHRLMSGYSNVAYRDTEVLQALNDRFMASKLALVHPHTIAQMLLLGCRLRGLEEPFVDRIVELCAPESYFWKKMFRPKDAAMIAYSLAGFEKLTPGIFGECLKICKNVQFERVESLHIQESIDIMFVAQGLFMAYQFIRNRYSPSEARKYISIKRAKDLCDIIKKRNLTQSGMETESQKEVARTLRDMGIEIACPGLIYDGLYRADMVLQDTKVREGFVFALGMF